jgi:hypothetical protein
LNKFNVENKYKENLNKNKSKTDFGQHLNVKDHYLRTKLRKIKKRNILMIEELRKKCKAWYKKQ